MKKITRKGQIILYAASGLGINLLNIMMGSYLCSALLVGGFGEAAIPYQTYAQRDLIVPAVWAIFALAAKIIDGVIDIPMAAFTDALRTRWGRRRPAIVIGLVCALSGDPGSARGQPAQYDLLWAGALHLLQRLHPHHGVLLRHLHGDRGHAGGTQPHVQRQVGV